MSNLKQRLLSWMHGHVFAGDLIITLVIGVLLFGVTGGITYNPGLLFDLKPSTQMAWEAAMLIPLLIRRWRPQTGALLCVAIDLGASHIRPLPVGRRYSGIVHAVFGDRLRQSQKHESLHYSGVVHRSSGFGAGGMDHVQWTAAHRRQSAYMEQLEWLKSEWR